MHTERNKISLSIRPVGSQGSMDICSKHSYSGLSEIIVNLAMIRGVLTVLSTDNIRNKRIYFSHWICSYPMLIACATAIVCMYKTLWVEKVNRLEMIVWLLVMGIPSYLRHDQGYRNFEIQIGPLDQWRHVRQSQIVTKTNDSSFSSISVSEIDYFSNTL